MQAEFEQLSAIDYPFGERLPQPGEPVPVAEGIFWLRLPLPFALNHINLWLLRDGDGWTLVDTGYGSRDNIAIWQRLLAEALGGLPLRRIVVTHDHPDHIGLAQWLVPHERLMAQALAVAEHVAGLPPLAARLVKESVNKGLDIPNIKDAALADVYRFFALEMTEDKAEGHQAWRDRRTPVFHGR